MSYSKEELSVKSKINFLNSSAPIYSYLLSDICEFYNLSPFEAVNAMVVSTEISKECWNNLEGNFIEKASAFYRSKSALNYLFDQAFFHMRQSGKCDYSAEMFNLKKIAGNFKKIVDIGAGIGTHSLFLADRLQEIVWIETQNEVTNFSSWRAHKYGLNAKAITSLELCNDFSESFMICTDFLEHLSDPCSFFKTLINKINSGNCLYFNTCFTKNGGIHPMHNEDVDESELLTIVEQKGLKIFKMNFGFLVRA